MCFLNMFDIISNVIPHGVDLNRLNDDDGDRYGDGDGDSVMVVMMVMIMMVMMENNDINMAYNAIQHIESRG